MFFFLEFIVGALDKFVQELGVGLKKLSVILLRSALRSAYDDRMVL